MKGAWNGKSHGRMDVIGWMGGVGGSGRGRDMLALTGPPFYLTRPWVKKKILRMGLALACSRNLLRTSPARVNG